MPDLEPKRRGAADYPPDRAASPTPCAKASTAAPRRSLPLSMPLVPEPACLTST